MLDTKRDLDKCKTRPWNLPKVELIYSTNDIYTWERQKLLTHLAIRNEVTHLAVLSGRKVTLEMKSEQDNRNIGAWNLPKVELIYTMNDIYAGERQRLRICLAIRNEVTHLL